MQLHFANGNWELKTKMEGMANPLIVIVKRKHSHAYDAILKYRTDVLRKTSREMCQISLREEHT